MSFHLNRIVLSNIWTYTRNIWETCFISPQTEYLTMWEKFKINACIFSIVYHQPNKISGFAAPESSVKSDLDLFLKYSFPLWILCSVRAYLRNCSQKTNIFFFFIYFLQYMQMLVSILHLKYLSFVLKRVSTLLMKLLFFNLGRSEWSPARADQSQKKG